MDGTPPPDNFVSFYPVDVYFSDLDALGTVHHAHYPTLFDRMWAEFWLELGYSSRSADAFQVVRQIGIVYHTPIRSVGKVAVGMWTNGVGETSVDYGFVVRSLDGAVLHAEGERTNVRLDSSTLRPCPWTDPVRKHLLALQRSSSASLEQSTENSQGSGRTVPR